MYEWLRKAPLCEYVSPAHGGNALALEDFMAVVNMRIVSGTAMFF